MKLQNSIRTRLRALTGVVAVGLMVGAATLAPAPAHASVSNAPTKTAGLSGEAVFDLVVLDSGRVVLGGRFTGIGAFARANVGALLPTGKADPAFAPSTNGTVYAVAASEDGSRIFLGGAFTEVNGVPRHNLAAIDAVTGELIADWRADTAGDVPLVRTLDVSGNRLYVGGKFNSIDGAAKQKLAAIDVNTGNPVPWNTWVNGGVLEIRVSPDGNTVWIGGEFTRIRGVEKLYLGGIDAATGAPVAFAPGASGGRLITVAVSPDGSWVYGASDNNTVFAYRPAVSNTPVWTTKMSGNVQTMEVSPTELYLGGHFSQFVTQRIARPFIASADPYTGTATSWDTQCTGLKGGGWAMQIKGNTLHVGGQFTHFNGVQQRLYAKFAGTPTP